MAIYRMLQGASFNPEQTAVLAEAYECCLKAIGLVDRTDPITDLVAKKILDVAQRGEQDPHRICEQTMAELGIPPRAI